MVKLTLLPLSVGLSTHSTQIFLALPLLSNSPRQNHHHDTTFIAQSNLERLSSVIELIRIGPVHASLDLLLSGIFDVGQGMISIGHLCSC